MLQGIDLHDAPLGLPGGLHRGCFERVCVFLKELVGHVSNLALGLCCLHGVLYSQGDDHLVFPEGDGVHDGGLDLLGHHVVGGLYHPDLRGGLQGDGPGQLQVV